MPSIRFLLPLVLLASATIDGVAAPDKSPEPDRRKILEQLKSFPFTGESGRLGIAGEHAFALVADRQGRIPAAAGYFQGNPAKGLAIVFAHDGILSNPTLLKNAASWVGRGDTHAVVIADDDEWVARLKTGGFQASMADSPDALAGASLVLIANGAHVTESKWTDAIRAALDRGCGMIVASTTWALEDDARAGLDALISTCGIRIAGHDSFEIPARLPLTEPSSLLSIPKACAAVQDASTTAADRKLACRVLEDAVKFHDCPASLASLLRELAAKYGHLSPTTQKPYLIGADPLSDLRMAEEIRELTELPVDQLFVHPSAEAFPGLGPDHPGEAHDLVFRAASPSKDAYVNEFGHGTWIETGLYARAGQVVTVQVQGVLRKGLHAMIGVHEDELWRCENSEEGLLRFPTITRTFDVDQPEVKIGSVFGGLIRFYTDPGVDLGEVHAHIEGAVEAPVYVLGKTTPEEWKRECQKPGEWGYLSTPRVTLYVQREALVKVDDPAAYALHWDEVMRLGDQWLGYAKWRVRPECAVQDVQVGGGLHHSGYPLMLGPGDGDHLIIKRDLVANGDWGVYHELGHGFQSCFHDGYTVATHAEVDVNLLPGLVYNFLHHRTAWDGPTHDTYDGPSRQEAMKKFLSAPEKERTWENACEGIAAYDFQFGLAEAFGWEIWRDALSRLMAFYQNPESDPELAGLKEGDEGEIRRDRLFACLCAASKSDLTPWFHRYGLGKGNFPLGKAALALAKRFPEWCGNRPISAIEGPLKWAAADGAVTYRAIDPDPGQVFEWDILDGNEKHHLIIDRRSGELKVVQKLEEPENLTLRVRDCGVPRTEKRVTITVTP